MRGLPSSRGLLGCQSNPVHSIHHSIHNLEEGGVEAPGEAPAHSCAAATAAAQATQPAQPGSAKVVRRVGWVVQYGGAQHGGHVQKVHNLCCHKVV